MKMKKKIMAAIIISVLLIAGIVYCLIAYNKATKKAYADGKEVGMKEATLLINQKIIESLRQNGFIVISFPINETTLINLKLAPVKTNG